MHANRLILSLALSSGSILLAPSAAISQANESRAEHSENADVSVRLRLAEPASRPLADQSLISALSGKTIWYDRDFTPDPDVVLKEESDSECPETEIIHPNGDWERSECGRGPISITGKWSVKGAGFCVTAAVYEKELCRVAWKTANENRVIMSGLGRDQYKAFLVAPVR